MTDTTLDELDVITAASYAEHGYPHDAWARLRAEDPVHRFAPEGYRPFWAITTAADITEVSRQPERFKSAGRFILIPDPPGFDPGAFDDNPPLRMLVNQDPPEHRDFRKLVSSWFTPRAIAQLEARLDDHDLRIFDCTMYLLAASLDFAMVQKLSWRTVVFVLAVVLIARPLTVLLSLVGTDLPRNERLLIALTGPRGVVLVAVAGLFGGRLAEAGVADGDLVAPLAFALVVFTVVLHGFTFAPLARWLGLSAAEAPGVLLVGGSRFTTGLAEVLKKAGVEVLISDPNHAHLIRPRALGLRTFYGDILSEAAEHQVELLSYETLLAATDNDAYNTLVATDFAPEFGRDRTWQIGRAKSDKSRHALPTQLGGRPFAAGRTHDALDGLIEEGWSFRATKLSEEFAMADWREKRPDAILLGTIGPKGTLRLLAGDKDPEVAAGHRLVFLLPPGTAVEEPAPAA